MYGPGIDSKHTGLHPLLVSQVGATLDKSVSCPVWEMPEIAKLNESKRQTIMELQWPSLVNIPNHASDPLLTMSWCVQVVDLMSVKRGPGS